MSRRRHAVRLGIPALIVAALAVVALWRVGAPPADPEAVATTGNLDREAKVEAIEVRQLTSANTFWAGKIDEPPLFVVVDRRATRERGVRVQPGNTLGLIGEVRPVPPEEDMRRDWGIDEATARSVHDVGTYLHVMQLRVAR